MVNLKKIVAGTLLATLASCATTYTALVAPVVPYTISDLQQKERTEQGRDIMEKVKTVYGSAVWFPLERLDDLKEGRKKKYFVANKEEQKLFVFDREGNLEYSSSVSTGKEQVDVKTKFKENISPAGDYIAVKRFNEDELFSWFGPEKFDYYGQGMLLFLGQWFPHIAIHGTNQEKYLGTAKSKGCVRVDQETIEKTVSEAAITSILRIQPYGVFPVNINSSFNFNDYFYSEGLEFSQFESAREDLLENNPQLDSIMDISKSEILFLKDYDGDGKVN